MSTVLFRRLALIAAAALLVTGVNITPLYADGGNEMNDPGTGSSQQQKKKKKTKKAIEEQRQQEALAQFRHGYNDARLIVLAGNYRGGLAAMHALGHDEHPDVANYIGYSYRKLGNYEASKLWYEKALATDPHHVRTLSYYGMWFMEQGNRLKALDELQKVKLICGNTTCDAYRHLKEVIDGKASY